MSLIDQAIHLKGVYEKQNSRPIDKLWTVFDRDSFSVTDFNNAIIRCKNANPEIGCAWSNEAFELWYLLHFHYYNNGMSRRDYQRMIEENLRPVVGEGYEYQKNYPSMRLRRMVTSEQRSLLCVGDGMYVAFLEIIVSARDQ